MKKILINFLYWGERESGIYRVSWNIVKNLSKISENKLYCITNYYKEIDHKNIELIPVDFKTSKKITRAIEMQFYLLKILKKLKPDFIFNPFHYGLFSKKVPQACVIHDIINMTVFKERFSTYFYHKFLLNKLINSCSFIIVPSNSTKEDLIKIFKVDENKIKVVFWAVDEKFKKLNINKENFYLIVNPTFPYKNVHHIINLWKKFNIEDKLIIIGHHPQFLKYYFYLKNLVKKLNLEDKITFYERVSDEKLVEFYNKAKALISPSIKEGFNLPPLEALACGTPVILSNIPVHKEIYGDIGIFFDLDNDETFMEALNKLKKLDYKEFENKRLNFLKKFSWENSAKEIYKSIKECTEK